MRKWYVIGMTVGDDDSDNRFVLECTFECFTMRVQFRPRVDHDDVLSTDDVRTGSLVAELRWVVGDHPRDEC